MSGQQSRFVAVWSQWNIPGGFTTAAILPEPAPPCLQTRCAATARIILCLGSHSPLCPPCCGQLEAELAVAVLPGQLASLPPCRLQLSCPSRGRTAGDDLLSLKCCCSQQLPALSGSWSCSPRGVVLSGLGLGTLNKIDSMLHHALQENLSASTHGLAWVMI